jgi:protein phosphatase 1 regulatory subunit 7
LSTLEELYLAWNALESVDGLPIGSLRTVDLSTNKLRSIQGVEQHAATLEELWMTKSLIENFDELEPLTRLPKLKCIYLEHSPVARQANYRSRIIDMLPTLEELDATDVVR